MLSKILNGIKFYILKNITILIYYNHIILKIILGFFANNKIILSDKQYFNKGNNRHVYIHPDDPNKCIKILKRFKLWNDNIKEYQFWLFNKNPSLIPKYYGLVVTNYGIGNVHHLIRNHDNNVSLTLDKYVKKKLNFDINKQKKLVNDYIIFSKKLFLYYDIDWSPDYLKNIIVNELNNDTYKLLLVDDYNPKKITDTNLKTFLSVREKYLKDLINKYHN